MGWHKCSNCGSEEWDEHTHPYGCNLCIRNLRLEMAGFCHDNKGDREL